MSKSLAKLDALMSKQRYTDDELFESQCLQAAKEALADMLDYGVHSCKIPLTQLWADFLASDLAEAFEVLDFITVLGKSGQELVGDIYYSINGNSYYKLASNTGTTPEHWLGFFLVEYQWLSEQTYADITKTLPITDLLSMYHPYLEINPRPFFEKLDSLCFCEE